MNTLLLTISLLQEYPAPIKGMSPFLKDWIQIIQWSVAIIGGLIAAFIGIYQLKASTKQRNSELRWKRANLAREILNGMWNDPYCLDAILMLEWKHREYSIKSGNDSDSLQVISDSEVLSALANPGEPLDNKRRYVRDCFVRFFKMAEIIGHYVRIELIDIDDLRYPYRFYVKRIDDGGKVYYDFLKYYNFKNALRLFSQIKQMKPLPQPGLKEGVST